MCGNGIAEPVCQAFARSASQLVVARRVGAPRCKEHMRATVILPWWNSDKVTSSWNISQDNHPSCLVHMAATRMLAQPRLALNPLWRTSGVYVEDFRREESWCFGCGLGEVHEEQFQGSPTESFVRFVNKCYETMKINWKYMKSNIWPENWNESIILLGVYSVFGMKASAT